MKYQTINPIFNYYYSFIGYFVRYLIENDQNIEDIREMLRKCVEKDKKEKINRNNGYLSYKMDF
jgi:hypothetical protein